MQSFDVVDVFFFCCKLNFETIRISDNIFSFENRSVINEIRKIDLFKNNNKKIIMNFYSFKFLNGHFDSEY